MVFASAFVYHSAIFQARVEIHLLIRKSSKSVFLPVLIEWKNVQPPIGAL
jgi:hypothetical protein